MTTHVPALSTLALTIYNALAVSRRALDYADILHHPIVVQQCGSVATSQCQLAVVELMRLRRIKLVGEDGCPVTDGAYRVRDHAFRLCIKRNKLDAATDPDTGEITGGWTGWMLQDNTPIEEVETR